MVHGWGHGWGAWLAQSVEHATLDLEVMSSGAEITSKKRKKKRCTDIFIWSCFAVQNMRSTHKRVGYCLLGIFFKILWDGGDTRKGIELNFVKSRFTSISIWLSLRGDAHLSLFLVLWVVRWSPESQPFKIYNPKM